MRMVISFYWYQNICPCDLSYLLNWSLSEAFVFHKHIVFSFSYINFIEIILNHLTIIKFNSILPHVSYLNAGLDLLYYMLDIRHSHSVGSSSSVISFWLTKHFINIFKINCSHIKRFRTLIIPYIIIIT